MTDEPAQQPEKKKYGPGRPRKGEVRPPKYPPPASKEEAEKNVKALVAKAASAVIADRGFPKGDTRWLENPNAATQARIKHLFGEDLEKARQLFAVEMMKTASDIVERIGREVEKLPHSTLGFTLSVLVDKSSHLLTKHATSGAGAQVGTQINIFGDGSIDREALIRQLHGVPTAPDTKQPPVDVTATPAT